MRYRPTAAVVSTLLLLAAGCGSGESDRASDPSPSTSTSTLGSVSTPANPDPTDATDPGAEIRFRPVLSVTQVAGRGESIQLSDLFAEDGGPTGSFTTTTTATSGTSFDAILADVTRPEDDRADQVVLLPEAVDGEVVALYTLGAALLTGEALETAAVSQADIGSWQVNPVFKVGDEGIGLFNAAAATCFGGADPGCPAQPGGTSGQIAIVFDSVVISAPEVQAATFDRDQIQISANFDEQEARQLAAEIRGTASR